MVTNRFSFTAPAAARHAGPARKGMASVLAMLYLVLFSTLAIGFYAATTLSSQIARNDRSASVAQLAAQSGMQFMRYQMGTVSVPTNTPVTQVWSTCVVPTISTALNGTQNLNGGSVVTSGSTMYIPSQAGWITLDSSTGAKFRAVLYQLQSGGNIYCDVTGMGSDPNVSRKIELQFAQAPKASAIFNYGVASKGQITTAGASYILGSPDPAKGSVLSTDMVDATPVSIGGKQVSGDISITNASGTVSYSGASIGGTSDPNQIPNHIHKGVPTPAFPTVDSTPYINAVTMTAYTAGSKTLTNNYIPANTNPSFSGNTTINGVLWIKAPNVVNFGGNLTITGVIVVDNNVAFNATKNQINFTGNVSAQGVQALPNNSTYANLRSLTGGFLLAPGFSTSFKGDFGTVAGSIIASQISMTGNATGIVQGSVIGVDNQPLTLNGSSDITISSTGTSSYPPGVTFGYYYAALPDTYLEVTP